jgi:LEA14-like dessication related protein
MNFKGIFAIGVALIVSGCANLSLNDVYQNPTFKYQSTGISDVSFQSLTGTSSIQIENKNPYQLPISSLNAELWLEGQPWLALNNDAISGLPAQSAVIVNFQWDLIFDQLLNRASAVYQAGEAEFTLKMAPTLSVPVLGPQTVSWASTFTVPVPKLPKVSISDWSINKVSLTTISLGLALAVENPNVFAINTDGWRLDVGKGSQSLVNVALDDSTIGSSSTSIKNVEFNLSLVDVGFAVASALKSGQWPDSLAMDWQGKWDSPDLGFKLPDIAGKL